MKFNFTVAVLFVLLTLKIARAQAPGLPESDSLENYIVQAMECWNIPGAAVYVVKDGEILLQKGFGYSNLDTKRRVDEQTVFPIASVSKTFTGTLFATLEAEGNLSLDDPVKKWLPWFSMKDKLYERQLTMADILSHRSGWKTFQGDLLNTESSMDYRTMIEKFGHQQPVYPIRTKFGYSNFGFIIAGECIKNITQQSWNTSIKKRFLLPLGMNRTLVFDDDIRNDSNTASGHTIRNGSLVVLPPDKAEPYAHGGLFASVQDMGVWVSVLLNKGSFNGDTVIPLKAIDKMWQSYTILGKSRAADRERYFKTYGLGWEIMQYHNNEVISHGGAYSGALASITLVPSMGLGIVILTNQDRHMLQETLKWQLIDAFMQKEAPNYTLATIEWQNKRNAERKIIGQENETEIEEFGAGMDALTGKYTCEGYGKAFIEKKNEHYVLTLEHHPGLEGVFSPYKKDQLMCTYNHSMFGKVPFSFKLKDGQVESFMLYVDDFIEADGYEFEKQ